jgi:hypothetical protein
VSKEKLLGGQRYFISKIMEYFSNQQSHSHLFYKALQEKRYDSLVLIFDEFLEIEKDIKEGTSDKSKLKNSLHSSLKVISFHCKNNPWALKGPLSRDIKHLVKKISKYLTTDIKDEQEKSKLLNTIKISISSLRKNCNSESLISEYIDLILNNVLTFKDIDLLVQYLTSEFLNLGYSLKFLGEWKQQNKILNKFTKDLNEEELSECLLVFKDLIKESRNYRIIINCWLPNELKQELDREGFIGIHYKYRKLSDEEQIVIESKMNKLNYPKAGQYQSLLVEVEAYDKYKAIEKVVKNLESYLEMYKYYLDFKKSAAVNVNCLLKYSIEEWIQLRTDDTDTQIFNKSMSVRENEDIKDFLLLRNEIRISEGDISTSIKQLSNSLGMIKESIEDTPENRLLNSWSSLEYILNSYEGKSIIGKIIDIVPKVIALYLVKDRMNILWDRLLKIKKSRGYQEIAIINELFQKCSKEDEKYDKNKLVEFLSKEENIKSLYDNVERDTVLHREIAFMREILWDMGKLKKQVETLHELIEHDLTRIYRVRNKLVHSENNILFNVDIFTIRLNKYITSLIGTIIHYLKRKPDLHISEVLNSIHETYEWYLDFLEGEKEKAKEIEKEKSKGKETDKSVDIKTASFPPYLYM